MKYQRAITTCVIAITEAEIMKKTNTAEDRAIAPIPAEIDFLLEEWWWF